MDIRISQTYAKIGVETQRAQLNLRNNNKFDYTISHTNPRIEMSSTKPQLHIDQSKCFAEAGLKGIRDFAAEATQLAEQNTMDYIAKKAEQGDSFANLKNKGNPILDAIYSDLNPKESFNIKAMPESRPEIYVEEGELDIQVIPGEVNPSFNFTPIETEFVPNQIQFYLRQEGSVNIEYVGRNVDLKG